MPLQTGHRSYPSPPGALVTDLPIDVNGNEMVKVGDEANAKARVWALSPHSLLSCSYWAIFNHQKCPSTSHEVSLQSSG